jgi:hypothetical protein
MSWVLTQIDAYELEGRRKVRRGSEYDKEVIKRNKTSMTVNNIQPLCAGLSERPGVMQVFTVDSRPRSPGYTC